MVLCILMCIPLKMMAETETTPTNPLSGRVYTQGYYLAGSFFNFSGDNVTYDDAVFKFQQQGNDTEGNAVYKVEIPASLTAHAQVMSVDAFGKIKKVYGPGSAYGISYTCPETGMTTSQLDLTSSETQNEGNNYWNIKTRNERADEYSDGMYEVFITVDKTGEPTKWQFKHIGNKRVAFFISDAKNATAMPVYDRYKKEKDQFSDKFFASVNLSAEHSYYVISNYVMKDECISYTKDQYGTLSPNGDVVNCPTTNKLFLLGNGGFSIESTDQDNQHNQFSPNEAPMKPSLNEQGSHIIEYNPSMGHDGQAKTDKHLGIRGQVLIRDGRKTLTSVSLVGDAIPGTVKDGVWDYTSTAADMTYDETEKCYKVTLETTVDDGKGKFRFVGNHTQGINWHEDSNDDASMMAKTPYNGDGKGHAATSYDPNKVNYTQNNDNPGEDWNIIWNRPAGRWTVRLFFYTYSDGNDPVTDYYYTITENDELELRDFDDVVYKSLDNRRYILNRGDYKYFRTWSSDKAWKISKDVDIFVVDGMKKDKKDEKDVVTFSLKNINEEINADPTYNVIPSKTGVILATKKKAADIAGGAVFHERASFTSYNTMVLPMEEYSPTTTATSTEYKGETNLLKPLITAQVVPTTETKEGVTYYNYLFGFYQANKGLGVNTYDANQFLLGFWISNGTGKFYSNSACLPIAEADADKMNLGVSYNDFGPTGGMKIPALFFDFANADGTTGIDEVVNTTVKNNDGKYYTLSGQQVEKPTAGGVYIHNGKKFVVK